MILARLLSLAAWLVALFFAMISSEAWTTLTSAIAATVTLLVVVVPEVERAVANATRVATTRAVHEAFPPALAAWLDDLGEPEDSTLKVVRD